MPKETLNGRPSTSCMRSPGDSWVPANHEPIITDDAPAARASATSRGWRTPPSAHTCLPSSRAAVAHSRTAENCGRPTPVIILVVHIAPGPTPTLTMSAPASISARVPSADTTLPAATGIAGSRRAYRGEGLQHPLLVAVGGVDDEAVHTGLDELGSPGRDVPVDADGGGDPQPPVRVARRGVERRSQCAEPGEDSDQRARRGDGHRERRLGAVDGVVHLTGVGVRRDGHDRTVHHRPDLGEAVDLGTVVLRHHAHRPAARRRPPRRGAPAWGSG